MGCFYGYLEESIYHSSFLIYDSLTHCDLMW